MSVLSCICAQLQNGKTATDSASWSIAQTPSCRRSRVECCSLAHLVWCTCAHVDGPRCPHLHKPFCALVVSCRAGFMQLCMAAILPFCTLRMKRQETLARITWGRGGDRLIRQGRAHLPPGLRCRRCESCRVSGTIICLRADRMCSSASRCLTAPIKHLPPTRHGGPQWTATKLSPRSATMSKAVSTSSTATSGAPLAP